jgi:hypothetical protein
VEIILPFQGAIRMYDQSGRTVRESGICSQWVFEGSGLPAGVYIVRAYSPSGEASSLRVVKVD